MTGFRNYLVTKLGVLIREAIKSPNYAAGSAGWSINKDGSAEFNNVTIRGTLFATSGPSGETAELSAGELFLSFPGDVTSSSLVALGPGEVQLQSGTEGTGDVAASLRIWSKNAGPGGSAGTAALSVPLTGCVPGTTTPETWHTLATGNGWTTSIALKYRYLTSPPNSIQIAAYLIPGSTIADATIIATLPSGYIPAHSQFFTAWAGTQAVGIEVDSTGNIRCFGITASMTRVAVEIICSLDY